MKNKYKYKLYAKKYKSLNLLKVSARLLDFKRPKWYAAQDFIRAGLWRRLMFYSQMYIEEQNILKLRKRNKKYLSNKPKQRNRSLFYRQRSRFSFLGYYARKRLRRQFFLPFSLPRIYLRNWKSNRVEYNYNNKLDFYRELLYYYGRQKQIIKPKKLSLASVLSSVWAMAVFKPFTLLWYLRFYPSAFSVKNGLHAKSIYLNEEPLKKNCLLKAGDLLSCQRFGEPIRQEVVTRFFHLEGPLFLADKYTREVVVLRDFKSLDLDLLRNISSRDSDIRHIDF